MEGLTRLSQRDAVELATAWASSRARIARTRALVLKGPIAEFQGLRAAKISADVDLLVEPHRLPHFLDNVKSAGWIERERTSAPRIIDWHSVTLIHPEWPIDLDVHMSWPGFLMDSAAAFDLLWDSRSHHELARVDVEAPSIPDASLILALHALRNQRLAHAGEEVGEIAMAVTAVLGAEASQRLGERAIALGATQTARPFLRQLGLVVEIEDPPSPELIRWQVNSIAASNTDAWLWKILSLPWSRRPRAIARALFPTPTELRISHPYLERGFRGIVKGWTTRLMMGLRELPRAARSVSAARRKFEGPTHE